MKANKMRNIEIEKVVLNVGLTGAELDKGVKLLSLISSKKAVKTKSKKRIPSFGIRPGLEIGAMVTIRGKESEAILRRLLASVGNKLKSKQINEEDFSFGIAEYIEIPGMEYQRDIGMMGLNVSVVFQRKGKRVMLKKIKRGKFPQRQRTTKKEIIAFLKDKFNIEITEGKK
ncbi:50S ribosomal protein L5 [Candidatus Pacearchaeota archaeon RBG_13_36_9]|nr:large subunit ribosomal protein L5 [uncultured archaeon]OGJ21394.1 MAG: 50S ribosomal protein L5 [Candidatus Pacearchaeota archaeon RBG_13_36_9]